MPTTFSTPVIQRELRVQSRQRQTYYLRSFWGLAVVVFLILGGQHERDSARGDVILSIIHGTFAAILLIAAPLTAADSISRERRESTLGLLFLTPLTASQIVRQKFFVHFIRLLSFWLLMMPFLMIPFLTGGFTLEQFFLSMTILFAITTISLSATMIASAISIRFGVAVVRALLFALAASYAIATLAANLPFSLFPPTPRFRIDLWQRIVFGGIGLIAVPNAMVDLYQRVFTIRHLTWYLCGILLISAVFFQILAHFFCLWRIRRHAEAAIETKRQAAFRRVFMTPVIWKEGFRRHMARRLDGNPFAWLEYRAVWARVAQTASLLILIGIEAMLLLNTQSTNRAIIDAQVPLLTILVIALTLKSTTSFQYEKENGAFELIVISPITEAQLVAARLRAVRRYFLPFTIIIPGICVFFTLWNGPVATYNNPIAFFNFSNLLLSLVTIPSAGLYFALRCDKFFACLALTVATSIFAAPILWTLFCNLILYLDERFDFAFAVIMNQTLRELWFPPVALAAVYHFLLLRSTKLHSIRLLQRRAF